jgi:hypothetical protein
MILSLREGGYPIMKLNKDVTEAVPVTINILAPSKQDIYHSNLTTTDHYRYLIRHAIKYLSWLFQFLVEYLLNQKM